MHLGLPAGCFPGLRPSCVGAPCQRCSCLHPLWGGRASPLPCVCGWGAGLGAGRDILGAAGGAPLKPRSLSWGQLG